MLKFFKVFLNIISLSIFSTSFAQEPPTSSYGSRKRHCEDSNFS